MYFNNEVISQNAMSTVGSSSSPYRRTNESVRSDVIISATRTSGVIIANIYHCYTYQQKCAHFHGFEALNGRRITVIPIVGSMLDNTHVKAIIRLFIYLPN